MLLVGPALWKISHLGCTAEAYEDAKDILQGFYGTTAEQLNSAWRHFDSLTPVDMGDIEGLERLLDKSRSSAALLRLLGVAEAGLDTNVRVLMQRIPEAVNRRILEKQIIYQENTSPTMEESLDSLATEIRISRASSQETSLKQLLKHTGLTSFPATELAAPSNYKKPAAETSGKQNRKAKRWTSFFWNKKYAFCWHVTYIHCISLRSPSFCSRTTRLHRLLPKAPDGFQQALSHSRQVSFSHRTHGMGSSASQTSTSRAQPATAHGASNFSGIRLYVYVDMAIVHMPSYPAEDCHTAKCPPVWKSPEEMSGPWMFDHQTTRKGSSYPHNDVRSFPKVV